MSPYGNDRPPPRQLADMPLRYTTPLTAIVRRGGHRARLANSQARPYQAEIPIKRTGISIRKPRREPHTAGAGSNRTTKSFRPRATDQWRANRRKDAISTLPPWQLRKAASNRKFRPYALPQIDHIVQVVRLDMEICSKNLNAVFHTRYARYPMLYLTLD